MLRGQPLENGVGMRREANGERADLSVRSDAVPDQDSPRPAHRDEGGERVRELALTAERARVEQVVPVEEVQRRLSHRVGAVPRTGAAPRRR